MHRIQQVKDYVSALNIGGKLDSRCGDLSGGQKRRMWVVCALLGNTPLILLDEPTSGMDPQARRDFWVLLKSVSTVEKRAVVFSTHYIEEADLLAQRKIILAMGGMVDLGSSQELKKRWGAGYWVHVAVDKKLVLEGKEAAGLLKRLGAEVVRPAVGGSGELTTKNRTMNDWYECFCHGACLSTSLGPHRYVFLSANLSTSPSLLGPDIATPRGLNVPERIL